MKLLSLTQTCDACPTQWEGTVEGELPALYARYRWGHLTVGVGATQDDAVDATFMADVEHLRKLVIAVQIGDEYDGVLDTGTMLRVAGLLELEEA